MTPAPGIEALAAELVELVRHYERNCRCPKCYANESGPLACVECEWCVANLERIFIGSLSLRAVNAALSACDAQTDRGTLLPMKKTAMKKATRSLARKKKTVAKMSKAPKKIAPKVAKKRKIAIGKKKIVARKKIAKNFLAKHAPRPVAKGAAGKTKAKVTAIDAKREYDRRVFVWFDSPALKATVKKAAGKAGLSPYIAHFATAAASHGLQMVVATPKKRDASGVYVRFATAEIKEMVRKAAEASKVSLSSYAAFFALDAVKAGKKLEDEADAGTRGEKLATATA